MTAPVFREPGSPAFAGGRVPPILRVNVAGQPVEWLTWQEAVCLHARDLIVWTLGETVCEVRGGRSRLTGETTTLTLHSILASDGAIGRAPRGIPPLTNKALFRRDQNHCLY